MHFTAHGHVNIKGTHKNTFEFTKAEHLTPTGDCIIGVKANYDTQKLKEFVQKNKRCKITLTVEEITETMTADTNPAFTDDHELVVRIGEHIDARTFAFRAEKSAKYLSRDMMKKLSEGATIEVNIEAAEPQ